MMIYFKACPKCKGDMQQAKDVYSAYRECIQCGFIQELGDNPQPLVRVEVNKAA